MEKGSRIVGMSLNQSPFLSNGNYQTLVGFLRKQYTGRMGTPLPERIDGRIQKTVQHFMTEIAKAHGTNRPVNDLDREVVREATKSLDEWLSRQESRPPTVAVKATTVSTAAYSRPTPMPTQTNYEQVAALFPTAWPTPIEEEQEDPVLLMKKAQQAREAELLAGKPRMEIAEVDPVPQAQPPPIRTVPLPQDYIIPQEPIVKYRNIEYNVFLTSSDRDWFRNRTENRYNFSVTFNPGNRTGFGYSPSVQERFRNIERIEFVKVIVPTESLTQLIRSTAKTATPGTLTTNADRVVNVLSLPFAGVRIAELNNNSFSTNPREDNTFALVQYDATWNSNIVSNPASTSPAGPLSSVGYTALIPKFLKCQRVYEPTPLAGLQKLTIRMERHDGALLNGDSDVFGIQRVCLSSDVTTIGTDTTTYSGSDNEYIYIQTSAYFAGSAMMEGDMIHVQGYTCAAGAPPASSTLLDFENFINGTLNVVAIACVNGGSIVAGVNAAGYANVIVVRSRFDDPSTGSVGRSASYFGGSAVEEGFLVDRIRDQASTASSAALINLSRQTHFVLRIVTRDMDSASNIRPDNV